MVKNIKEKMKALMAEDSYTLPVDWDRTLLHKALQIIRCDPSTATGFAPAQLILGRKLYYPMDLDFQDVDFTGTELTNSVVQALNNVHEKNFGLASKKIAKRQKQYKTYYDRKNKVSNVMYAVGDKVQMKVGKHARKSKFSLKWKPRDSYYEVVEVNTRYHTVKLKNPKTGYVFKKSKPFIFVRKYRSRN